MLCATSIQQTKIFLLIENEERFFRAKIKETSYNFTSKNDENSNWRVAAVRLSSPCDEVTNKQLRGHCKGYNSKVGVRNIMYKSWNCGIANS